MVMLLDVVSFLYCVLWPLIKGILWMTKLPL